MASSVTVKNEKYGLLLAKKIEYFLHDYQHRDINVVVGERNYNCHTLVLASFSQFFRKKLSESSDAESIDISDVCSSDTFGRVLDFIYRGKVKVPANEVATFMKEAKELGIETLQSTLENVCSVESINEANVIGLSCHSFNTDDDALKKNCLAYLCSNFRDVTDDNEFRKISYDILLDLLLPDDINVQSEDEVLDALLCWANFDCEEKEENFLYLLKNRIRHGCVSQQRVVSLLREGAVCCNPDVVEFISEWLEFFAKINSELPGSKFNKTPRNYKKVEGSKIIFISDDDVVIRAFDVEKKIWEDLPSLPVKVEQPVAAIFENKLYVVGGGDKSVMFSFDFMSKENVWKSRPAMKTPRKEHGMVVFDNNLYVIGGLNKDGPTKSVECFDFHDNEWSAKADLPVALRGVAVCIYYDNIYCFGGNMSANEDGYTTNINVYSVYGDRWSDGGRLLREVANASAVSIADRMFIFGGEDDRGIVNAIYEYLRQEKAVVKRAEGERMIFDAFAHNEKEILLRDYDNDLSGIRVYDIVNSSFSDVFGEFKGMKNFGAALLKLKK